MHIKILETPPLNRSASVFSTANPPKRRGEPLLNFLF